MSCRETFDSLYDHEDVIGEGPDIVLESTVKPYDIIPEDQWADIDFGNSWGVADQPLYAVMGTDDMGETTLADQRPSHYVKLTKHIRMMKGNVTVEQFEKFVDGDGGMAVGKSLGHHFGMFLEKFEIKHG